MAIHIECGNKGNSLEFIAHVILEKQSGNVPKGTKKKTTGKFVQVRAEQSLIELSWV